MVSTQFHARVKVFQTDNGGEYVNNTLACFFCAQGIIHQTTTPFTPQQNGVSKRKNRHLLEVARSLILDMSIPHHFWGHVVMSAAYLVDRTPSRVLDFRTPYNVFGDHVSPISVSKLPPKVFGCVAYVHVYSHQRSKLDHCALRCVFIGYFSTQKGYKYYHPPTQKKGSEFESLRLEDFGLDGQNTVYEDVALGKEMIAHIAEGDWSPRFRGEDVALNDETTECDNDSCDSWVNEFNARPASALPLLQSSRENELSEHKVDSFIDRYKARLVAKGYTQTYGVDYIETFALVAKFNTVRVLLSLAANYDRPLLQFNVKNAFLHSDLKQEIYMYLPPIIHITSKEGVVCKLRQFLYGLK
ncbi:unnamed protein product [Prunus brigantina]